MTDHVDEILGQWSRERPDVDASPMGVFGRMARLSRIQVAASERRLARLGLDSTDFDVLATLRRSGEPYALTPGRLAEAVMLTSGGMTGRIDRLAASGLVEREQDQRDRRSVRVRLTDAGRSLVDEALVEHLAAEHALLEPLSDAERTRLTALLRKLLSAHRG